MSVATRLYQTKVNVYSDENPETMPFTIYGEDKEYEHVIEMFHISGNHWQSVICNSSDKARVDKRSTRSQSGGNNSSATHKRKKEEEEESATSPTSIPEQAELSQLKAPPEFITPSALHNEDPPIVLNSAFSKWMVAKKTINEGNAHAESESTALPSTGSDFAIAEKNAMSYSEDMECTDQPIVLHTPNGIEIQLPVGIGLTPTIWKNYNHEAKKTIADHFKCKSIGHFEDDFLNVGNTLAESELTALPSTESDFAIAQEIATSDSEDLECTSSDAAIAASVADDEAAQLRLVIFTCHCACLRSTTH